MSLLESLIQEAEAYQSDPLALCGLVERVCDKYTDPEYVQKIETEEAVTWRTLEQVPATYKSQITVVTPHDPIFGKNLVFVPYKNNQRVHFIGDIHGGFEDLCEILRSSVPEEADSFGDNLYIFLGDYVDRGDQSIETLALLMLLLERYPNNFICLQGNHEGHGVKSTPGDKSFYSELKRKLHDLSADKEEACPKAAVEIDEDTEDIFTGIPYISPDLSVMSSLTSLPSAAVVFINQEGTKAVIAVHGGVPPHEDILGILNKHFTILWGDPITHIYHRTDLVHAILKDGADCKEEAVVKDIREGFQKIFPERDIREVLQPFVSDCSPGQIDASMWQVLTALEGKQNFLRGNDTKNCFWGIEAVRAAQARGYTRIIRAHGHFCGGPDVFPAAEGCRCPCDVVSICSEHQVIRGRIQIPYFMTLIQQATGVPEYSFHEIRRHEEAELRIHPHP